MSPFKVVPASILAASLILSGAARAQTANGSPTAPASPGLVGTPRPVSRTAPSTRVGAVKPDFTLPDGKVKPLPKLTAAERAEQKKLEHDLHICIGC